MKKAVLAIAVTLVGSILQAVPVIVTARTLGTPAALYTDALMSIAVPSGYYAELITSASATYNDVNYETYTVLGQLSQDSGATYTHSDVYVGKSFTGSALGDGKLSMYWKNDSVAAGQYIAIRFYNATTVGAATKYGVTSFQALTKTGSVGGTPTAETISWTTSTTITTQNRYYTSYSLTPVPEPTTMALFGLGGLALVIRRKMRKEA